MARMPATPGPLNPMPEKSGLIGDFKLKSFKPIGDAPAPGHPTAWLPSARVARAWQAILTAQPFQ